MHCIPLAFSQCFMHLDVCLFVENCVLLGLDWVEPMMQLLLARHMLMHISCIRTLSFLFLALCCDCVFCFSTSLSLSDRPRIAPSANPLCLGTLFVPGHLFQILLLFTFGSMMRMPIRTSRRTFLNAVFIQSTTWFYRTFSILLYLMSFTLEDGNLSVRYP